MANGERRLGEALADRVRERSNALREERKAAIRKLDSGWERKTNPEILLLQAPKKSEAPGTIKLHLPSIPRQYKLLFLGILIGLAAAGIAKSPVDLEQLIKLLSGAL